MSCFRTAAVCLRSLPTSNLVSFTLTAFSSRTRMLANCTLAEVLSGSSLMPFAAGVCGSASLGAASRIGMSSAPAMMDVFGNLFDQIYNSSSRKDEPYETLAPKLTSE